MKEEKIAYLFQTIRQLPSEVDLASMEQFVLMQPATVYATPSGGNGGWINLKNSFIMISSITVIGLAIKILLSSNNSEATSGIPPASESISQKAVYSKNLKISSPGDDIILGQSTTDLPKNIAIPQEIIRETPKSEIDLASSQAHAQAGVQVPATLPNTTANSNLSAQPLAPLSEWIRAGREMPVFSEVELQCDAYVEIVSGDRYNIAANGEITAIDDVSAEVIDGVLYIRKVGKKRKHKSNGILITIPADKLKKIKVTGSGFISLQSDFSGITLCEVHSSGSIYTEKEIRGTELHLRMVGSGGIETKNLIVASTKVEILGSGMVWADGTSDALTVNVTGSGNAEMGKLNALNVEAIVSGSGIITVNATRALNAQVTGSGFISYYGTPTLKQVITGSGEILHVE